MTRRRGREIAGERDVLANQPREHRLQVQDREVQVHFLRQEHLLAAVGEQLLGQRGRALAGLLNLLEVAALGRVDSSGC